MAGSSIDRLATRLESVASSEPFDTRADLRRWIGWPLLDVLGWPATGAAVRSEVGVAGESVDVLLSVDIDGWVPAVVVAIDAGAGERDALEAVERSLAATGVDRGLVVRPMELVCVTGGATTEHRSVPYESLAAERSTLEQFRRATVRDRLAALEPSVRRRRRLAVDASSIREAILTTLSEETALEPATTRPVVERAIDTVLDHPVSDRPAAGDVPVTSETQESSAASVGGDDPSDTKRRSPPSMSAESGSESPGSAQPNADSTSIPSSRAPETDHEGEFVVRVFNERGSIGAVGHSTSAGALCEATEYFFERGLGGVRLPWETDDGVVVLADQPADGDGTPWNAHERLSNGTVLNTSGTVADRARRVEALAERAGLRVLLTGDWKNQS